MSNMIWRAQCQVWNSIILRKYEEILLVSLKALNIVIIFRNLSISYLNGCTYVCNQCLYDSDSEWKTGDGGRKERTIMKKSWLSEQTRYSERTGARSGVDTGDL